MTRMQTNVSGNPGQAILEMMTIIDDLKGIYLKETEALNKADARIFLDLQDEKLTAAMKYKEKIESLLAQKESLKTASPALRQRLIEKEQEFSEISSRNMDSLSRMQRATERLGQRIIRTARDSAKKMRAVSYGESGALHTNEKKLVSSGVSETA